MTDADLGQLLSPLIRYAFGLIEINIHARLPFLRLDCLSNQEQKTCPYRFLSQYPYKVPSVDVPRLMLFTIASSR